MDIGAYQGDTAFPLIEKYKPEKVYAFEPEKNNYQKLLKNSKIINKQNNKQVLEIHKLGISDCDKTALINNLGEMSKLNLHNGEKIEITSIDNFVSKNNINKIDLIKMDIEGEESNAILGAIKTIKRDKPILLISIYHTPKDFFEIKPFLENLVPEYKFMIKKINQFTLNVDIMLLAWVS